MTSKNLDELRSYFEHNDLDLARRRLLDIVYDTADPALLKEAITWSVQFHPEMPGEHRWVEEGLKLTDKLQTVFSLIVPEETRLLISSEGISKTYGNGFFTLSSISMELYSGEILGVVGENGNGKTTLLRCVAGYLETTLGPENFRYVRRAKPFHYELKSATGFIPQRIPRWYGKLIDNLRFSAALHGIKGEQNELIVNFVLERFGLTRFANLTWTQISSGYRTRFEIARLILQRPAVLILDEPLANLDINAQQTLLQDLKFIARSARHPMGIILTSQQLFEVEKVADRVLFIKNGLGVYNDRDDNPQLRVFEIETATNREKMATILGEVVREIRFNGGVYEIHTETDQNTCLELLIKNKVDIRYYRDITASTKRYF